MGRKKYHKGGGGRELKNYFDNTCLNSCPFLWGASPTSNFWQSSDFLYCPPSFLISHDDHDYDDDDLDNDDHDHDDHDNDHDDDDGDNSRCGYILTFSPGYFQWSRLHWADPYGSDASDDNDDDEDDDHTY